MSRYYVLRMLGVKRLDIELYFCVLVASTSKQLTRDKIDAFLERLEGIPGLDYEVEGIVDRINSLQRRFRHAHEETLREWELTWGEWKVLASLRHGESSSPGELCEELELSSGAMTNRLDHLEEAGLVRRVPDPNDRRGVKIELTDTGRSVWTESTSAQAQKEIVVASALTKREQKELNSLLRKLMLAFERDRA
jgi:DNA-binding MarR family transcriptional regulator